MNKKSYSLRLKALGGLVVFLLLVIAQAMFQLSVLKQTEMNHTLLGQLHQIEQSIQIFPRRSQNYLDNAARDFESYRRDVKVFYKDLRGDFSQFDRQIKRVYGEFMIGEGKSLVSTIGDKTLENNANISITETGQRWEEFYAEFLSALGSNESEPLLEAGAQYVVNNHPRLKMSVEQMVGDFRIFLAQQTEVSESVLKVSLLLLILLGIIGLVWFYRRVIRRIGNTVDACQIVAGGDFGYTLPVEGRDEITLLSKAFNTLSSRTQMVLNMMANLQQATSVEQGLAVIVQASGSYLPVAWAGFLTVSDHGHEMLLTNAIPPKTLQSWKVRTVTAEQTFGKQLTDALISGRCVTLSGLTDHVLENDKEVFLRALVRATKVESLMALPLKDNHGWEGILVFGSRSAEYRPDQTELLEKMAPLMAASFAGVASENSTMYGGR